MKVRRSRATAAMAQRRLSPHHGPVQVSGKSIFEPALRQRESPAPTCMPLTTGMGVTLLAQLIRPTRLKMPTIVATTIPAAAFSSSVNFLAMATAAIAFMGWTGRGIPNVMPVKILAAPVKSRVDGSEIEFVSTRAVMSGRSVPRSPREPESSASGCDLIVLTLCICELRRRGRGFGSRGIFTCAHKEVPALIVDIPRSLNTQR